LQPESAESLPAVKSPQAKRSRLSEVNKQALEDISNFDTPMEMETSEISDELSQTKIKIPRMGERKFYRRIPCESKESNKRTVYKPISFRFLRLKCI